MITSLITTWTALRQLRNLRAEIAAVPETCSSQIPGDQSIEAIVMDTSEGGHFQHGRPCIMVCRPQQLTMLMYLHMHISSAQALTTAVHASSLVHYD